MKMKALVARLLAVTLFLTVAAIPMAAQYGPKFNPAKFKADRERYIAVEACLTPTEAAKFFPLYDEMNNKQRVLFDQIRDLKRITPADDEGCRKTIAEIDRLELEIKQLQANYHTRFMTIISPEKLFKVIRAEGSFHRQAMKNAAHQHGKWPRR